METAHPGVAVQRGSSMVEKTIELTGISSNSIEDAVNLAVNRAAVTIQGIREARIVDVAAMIEDGAVASWRVKVKVTFTVQDRVHE
jgi:hypothetical protein